jgi:hypothetical protein
LADFVLGKTYRNLKVNARASISTIDMDSLTGYQINGLVEIVEQGPQHRAILKDLSEREVKFATERVIATVVKGRRYKNFEVAFPEVFVILKMNVDEVTTIAPTGKLHKKRKSP